MLMLPTLLVSALALQAQAVSFSSYRGLGCRGEILKENQGLYPYRCTSAGSDASSIEAKGLQNKNNADSYIELYSDLNCKNYVSTVKHSGFCTNHNFQSAILFIPATSKAQETETSSDAEVEKRDLENKESDQQKDDQALLGRLDALRSFTSTASPKWQPRGANSLFGTKVIPRADGDLHEYSGDKSYQGIEDEDNNSPGDANGFTFSSRNQRDNWVVTLVQRMIRYRNDHGANELYTGAQTVGNHDLEFDFQVNEGTLNDFTNDDFANWAHMFGTQRDGHSHQVWDLFHANQLRATLTFKAYRIN